MRIEEKQMNTIVFYFSLIIWFFAYGFVMLFLHGTYVDHCSAIVAVFAIGVRVFEKRLGKYAKYLYSINLPLWGSFIIVFTNDGKYGAITQSYFLWLILSMVYYNEKVVKISAVVCLISNGSLALVDNGGFLKIHRIVIWGFIVIVYIAAVICAVIITKRTRNIFAIEQKIVIYEKELTYFQELQKKDEKYNCFIHDMNHYFKAMGMLVKQRDYEKIISLLEDLNIQMEQNTMIIYTNHRVLNAILTEKREEAQENGIEFQVYLEPNVNLGCVTDSDIVSMLGNLLENAMEATKKCEEETRKIAVRIFMERDGRICIFHIKNSFDGVVKRSKGLLLTTKEEEEGIYKHGIGIKNVKLIAEKYRGSLECLVEKKQFLAVLMLQVN